MYHIARYVYCFNIRCEHALLAFPTTSPCDTLLWWGSDLIRRRVLHGWKQVDSAGNWMKRFICRMLSRQPFDWNYPTQRQGSHVYGTPLECWPLTLPSKKIPYCLDAKGRNMWDPLVARTSIRYAVCDYVTTVSFWRLMLIGLCNQPISRPCSEHTGSFPWKEPQLCARRTRAWCAWRYWGVACANLSS